MSRRFATVDAFEQVHGPLPAWDRRIAYFYLDLGLSATESGRRLFVSESVVLRRLDAHGIARRRAGGSRPRLDHRVLQRATFLYQRLGLSLAAIAELEGVQPNAIRHRLRTAGVALRPRGQRRQASPRAHRLAA